MLTLVALVPTKLGRLPVSFFVKWVSEVMKMVGEKIYNLRKKKNLSQEDLASILNVSRQTISKWETGESTPDFNKIVPLCDYFGITTDELLKDNPSVYEQEIGKLTKKNTALMISFCIAILAFMIIMVVVLDEIKASDAIIVTVIMTSLALIAIILVNLFISKPTIKVEKPEDKKKRLIISIWRTIVLIIYFAVSIVFDCYEYSWLILIIAALLRRIVELILLMRRK